MRERVCERDTNHFRRDISRECEGYGKAKWGRREGGRGLDAREMPASEPYSSRVYDNHVPSLLSTEHQFNVNRVFVPAQ